MAKMPRFTIARLMLAVVVVAVNSKAAQLCYNSHVDFMLGTLTMGLVCQLAILRAIKTRRCTRAFWLGFLAFASASMASFVSMLNNDSGILFAFRRSYTDLSLQILTFLQCIPQPATVKGYPLNLKITAAVIWFLPQLLAALIGGYLTAGLARLVSARRQQPRREEVSQDLGPSVG